MPEAAATIYANLGEKDEALTWVEKGYDARSGFLPALRNSPAFDSLRSEPRFRDVMKKMNLPVEPAGAR